MELNFFDQIVFVIRLLVAGLCGFAIGFERKNRAKEAGIRTHFVVACASALMMIISKYGFWDIATETGDFIYGTRGADGARIAAQIVSGVGFLGAGMIFVHKNMIKGLTTAAGIWATAGIGMAIGAGMYFIGIATTVIILLAQVVLHGNISDYFGHETKIIAVTAVNEDGFRQKTVMMLSEMKIHVTDVTISHQKEQNTYDYVFTVELPSGFDEDIIISKFDYDVKIGSSL